MPYDASDLRTALASKPASSAGTGANIPAQYFEFGELPPDDTSVSGAATWWTRSQSIVVGFTKAASGAVLERSGQPDEYVVLVVDPGASVEAVAGEDRVAAVGRALLVMPPGASSVTATSDATIVRLFTAQSEDLAARCRNADAYAEADPNVAPFAAWPSSPDGDRIRAYDMDAITADPQRFGRILRCSTFMVNWFFDAKGPRDPSKLSPHHHDDFEQLSLQLAGDYVHHIRTPWTPDLGQWRDDEHQACSSPAVTVIPPPAIHTSQAVGEGSHLLIDIFAPPRYDFSARPGWVVNAGDYPMPADAATEPVG